MKLIPTLSRFRVGRTLTRISCGLSSLVLAVQIHAIEFTPIYEWNIELLSMDLNVQNVDMPLGPGWGPISTDIHVGLSTSTRSLGKAFAFSNLPEAALANSPPDLGEQFFVQSFFDVFFDITITDVDPAENFGGGPIDGLSMTFADNGPAHMQNFYSATADPNLPNFGLIPPPESAPYIGHFNIEIPLGADLNGNGENDKIKFTLVAHAVGDQNRTFITLPDGTVIDNFDSTADLSGAVVDESEDPPFGPISLTGPTTASSHLVSSVPDGGGTLMMLSGAVTGLLGMLRLRKRC